MNNWIDDQYIGLISNRLLLFKRKDKNLYNFRCPFCLDSAKSKTKARGWLYEKGSKVRYYCHNCNASMLFPTFLKKLDIDLHSKYISEKFIDTNFNENKQVVEDKPDFTKFAPPKFVSGNSPLKALTKISSLPIDHICRKYVVERKIPSQYHYKLFYCPKFKNWVNSFMPNKFDNLEKDHHRLIIPFLDREKKFFGLQGRALSNLQKTRYITIMLDESNPRVYGLDACDLNKDTYIFEGPIDSMFFQNSIAMCGSDLSKTIDHKKENMIVIFDNEPRSQQTVNKISKYIDSGYRVCLWPERIREKDVNAMILAGYDPDELKVIVNLNTYSGIEAKLNLQRWRKC